MFALWKSLDKTDKLVFFLGILVTIKVRIIGMFSVAELVLMAMFVFQRNSYYKSNLYVKKLWSLAILWMIGTIVSNIYNHVDQLDFVKGVFFLVVLILIIPPIYSLLYEKPERIVLFFLGYGLGYLFNKSASLDDVGDVSLGERIYLFYSLMMAVSGVSYFLYLKGHHVISILMRYAIAVAALFNMARNPFLTGTIAFFLIWLIRNDNAYDSYTAASNFKRKIPRFFLFAVIAMLVADSIYEPLAANGILGYEAQVKYYQQKMAGGNALEGGRSETFMGIQLIKENPIWGYGSYARDKGDAFHMRYAAEHNTEYRWFSTEDRLLPGHSHIVGAWVQNGILGGVFWLYVLFMCWKVFRSGSIMYEPRLLCLLMFQSCAFLWDLCFSPFGDRTFTMFFVITLLIIYDHALYGDYELGLVQKLDID